VINQSKLSSKSRTRVDGVISGEFLLGKNLEGDQI
jgi:hypothetical protein